MQTEIDITRWVIATGILAILLIVFANGLKMYIHKTPNLKKAHSRKKRFKVLETQYLDTKNKVCLIQFDKTEMVLGVSPSGISIIGSQEAEETVIKPTELENCTEDHMEGIGFLKKFFKGTCDVSTAAEKNKQPKRTQVKSKKASQK